MDSFAEGLYYIFIVLTGAIIVFGAIELTAMYWFLNLTKSRIIQLGLLTAALVPGYFLIMNGETIFFFIESLLFVTPMVVLIPFYFFSDKLKPTYGKILITYVGIVFCLQLFPLTNLFNDPDFYYYHMALANARIYIILILLEMIVTLIIHRILYVLLTPRDENKKPV
jgi:hypothetical protein